MVKGISISVFKICKKFQKMRNPIKICFCILTKKLHQKQLLAGWWTTCSDLCTICCIGESRHKTWAAFNSLHGFICLPLENKVWVKIIKSYCNYLSPKGSKLLATKSDHKRPQFLFRLLERWTSIHTLTMMLLFDGF
jgi:hypothetical protein